MFDRIASAFRLSRPATAQAAEQEVSPMLRTEVEGLFRSEMDSFTRIALDRRARKAHATLALAA